MCQVISCVFGCIVVTLYYGNPHLNAPLDSNKITWLAFFFLDLTFRGA